MDLRTLTQYFMLNLPSSELLDRRLDRMGSENAVRVKTQSREFKDGTSLLFTGE